MYGLAYVGGSPGTASLQLIVGLGAGAFFLAFGRRRLGREASIGTAWLALIPLFAVVWLYLAFWAASCWGGPPC